MAKHYSGKRAAGRKPVGKRALSLLMALVMSLSLVQITAFAVDEGETTFDDQVMTGWFTANGGTADTGVTNGGGFTLSKTIQQTGVNAFDITLTVETTQTVTTSDAAVQLIIDTSGSMAFCSVCGKERHGMKDTCKGSPSRLDATKAAVAGQGGFLDQLLAGNKSGGKIWVSVVEFANGAYKVCNWTDIRTSKGLQDVKKAVNDLEAGGGTNLDAGLMLAYNRLNMASVKEISKDNKYTVLLTDGEPTYHTKSDSESTEKITGHKGAGDKSSAADINAATKSAANVKDRSTLYTICYGAEDDVLSTETKVVCENCGKSQREHEKVWVVDGHHWLWGDYGHYEYYCDADHTKTYQKNTEQTVTTVGSFLKNSIASKPEFAFSDAGNVNKAFTDIATSTTTGMNGAGTYVTDPMGAFINLTEDAKAKLAAISGVSVDGSTIKWNLNPENAKKTEGEGGAVTYQYTLTYSVTLDTDAYGFESDFNYPTNGRTFLTIPAEEGDASEVDFNIPGVFGKKAEHDFYVRYYFENENGDYELRKNETLHGTAPYGEVYVPHAADYEGYTFNAEKSNAYPDSPNLFYQDGQFFDLYYDLKPVEMGQYKVIHKYYSDMDDEDNLTGYVGEVETDPIEERVGNIVNINSVDEKTTYNGVEYVCVGGTPNEIEITSGETKSFTLNYVPVFDGYYTVTVEYRDAKTGAEIGKSVSYKSDALTYDVVSKTKDFTGYTYAGVDENHDPMSGDLDSDKLVVFLYDKNPEKQYITVAVKYVEKNNTTNVLHDPQSEDFELVNGSAAYDVAYMKFSSLDKDGKTYNYDSASAELTGTTDKSLIITLYYTAKSSDPIIDPPTSYDYYTVTVNYYDKASGEVIHTAYTTRQREYTSYDVTAQDKIAIEGYTYVETSGDALTGTLNGNKVINVYYSKTTDIDDGDTPTTPAEPGSDIGDDDVPTTPAQPPKTGDSMGLWIAAALVSGMGLVWISLSGKKREEEV